MSQTMKTEFISEKETTKRQGKAGAARKISQGESTRSLNTHSLYCGLYLEDVAVTVSSRLKDDTNDVVRVIVTRRLAAWLHSTHQSGRQTATVGVEVHCLPVLLFQQHVRDVLVPVHCSVTVRVNLHEDLHQASTVFQQLHVIVSFLQLIDCKD